MTFGDRMAYARKQKKMRQADLGKLIGTSGDIIGKYERGENIPSIDVASKIADALNVTLDYLVKDGEYASFDKKTVDRINNIQKLDANSKQHVFAMLDAFLRDYKAKKTYATLSVFLGGCFLGQTVIDNTIQVFDFFC